MGRPIRTLAGTVNIGRINADVKEKVGEGFRVVRTVAAPSDRMRGRGPSPVTVRCFPDLSVFHRRDGTSVALSQTNASRHRQRQNQNDENWHSIAHGKPAHFLPVQFFAEFGMSAGESQRAGVFALSIAGQCICSLA